MKILVCGSEGHLMQDVISELLFQDDYYDEVIGVDNNSRHGPVKRKREYEFHNIDLTDRRKVDKLFTSVKPDYVIQGAATIYGVGGFNDRAAHILGEDVTLHQNVLRAATGAGTVRVIYISSSMVYETIQDRPVVETDTDNIITPRTHYGLSKLVGERLCEAYNKNYGLEYTIWRPFNIINLKEKAEGPTGTSHVFADFIHEIIEKGSNPVPILGDGRQVRCFTSSKDVARAIAEYSFGPETKNQKFNLGTTKPLTMRELATMIYEIGKDVGLLEGKKPLRFKTVGNYKNDVKSRIPNINKAKKILGWRPMYSAEDAIYHCVLRGDYDLH